MVYFLVFIDNDWTKRRGGLAAEGKKEFEEGMWIKCFFTSLESRSADQFMILECEFIFLLSRR